METTTTLIRETEKIRCEHLVEGDIHQITFYDSTRQAYDEYVDVMSEIYEDVTEDDMMRFLIDYRQSGLPNVTYAFRRSVKWVNGLDVHPEVRMATVTKREFVTHMFSSLIDTMRLSHLSIRFFEEEEGYQEALVWLQEK